MKASNSKFPIYWLGGSTYAGKTTISNIISEKYGFTVYHCDEYLGKHIEKSNVQKYPTLNGVSKICWNDILNMTVEEYLKWAVCMYNEEFEMILDDLYKLSNVEPVIVEGVGLLPDLINNRIYDSNHAIWVVADEVFYKRHQMERKELFERTRECLNPEQALQNYISYDLAMGKYITNSAKGHGFNVIEVKNDSNIIKNAEAVCSHFKFT
jgi:2-phosphoglycerate kinase